MKRLHIKTGDSVKILSGNDKGKIGEVIKVYPKTNRAIVQGVNFKTKHIKANREKGIPGKIEKVEAPMPICKLMYFDKESNKATRIGFKIEDGKRRRYMKINGIVI